MNDLHPGVLALAIYLLGILAGIVPGMCLAWHIADKGKERLKAELAEIDRRFRAMGTPRGGG